MKAQGMAELYAFLVEDYYNELCKKGYLSEQDTLYFICGSCDCSKDCFDYDIKTRNHKVQFSIPSVNKTNPVAYFYRLSIPELEEGFIIIPVGMYSVVFRGKNNDDEIIFSGTTTYFFKYNKKKLKYEFIERKKYGL
jgi:hypothetical protein